VSQVPAGTVGSEEDLDDVVRREAVEETGLENVILDRFLGEQIGCRTLCNQTATKTPVHLSLNSPYCRRKYTPMRCRYEREG